VNYKIVQVQNFTEIPKSDYSLRLRTLFIIPLVLVSLVLFPSWGKTLTRDPLVEGQKDTVTGHLEVRKLPHNKTIPQLLSGFKE
jgi:hypothetical protein